MNVPSKVVHESATQRQHIRVHLPVAVKFGGREYPAVNWSVAGLLLADVFDPPTPGLIIPLELVFDFEGFAFNLELTGELLRADPESGQAAFRFTELTPDRLSLLQHIIGAFIAGDVVSTGDLLAIAKRENFTSPRGGKAAEEQGSASSRLFANAQRLIMLGILWLIALSLVGLILVNAFTRLYIVPADGVLTSPEARIVRAAKAGTILAVAARPGTPLRPNQLLVTLQGADEKVQGIGSPCPCVAAQTFAEVGGFVQKGAPLVSVVPRDGRLSAEFLVPLDTAQRIKTGDPVSVIFYAGQKEAGARVERIVLPTFTETNAFATIANGSLKLTAIIRVRFDSRLPVDYVGQPASARINTFQLLR